ncbi:hypothetical protein HXX76_016106 [Chlamydomonas incerta]|uniref:CN hydrolase domain-containing protein n=1 Tax=Chlamydomonas incerta TaxID=51695 RepID=A0A835SLU4_CHLIN|nr:hypothetical protein HXX76_016106 [Chlamydomonas incerta]|eukprot:KAG2422346.1 hypothetical protein HXX76_016106 [Chlamydomonas incerta]
MQAPRLTRTAAAAHCRAPALVPSNPAAASPASECQDNYVVLQNAAAKSQRLLAQMQRLRGEAIAALQASGEEAVAAAAEAVAGSTAVLAYQPAAGVSVGAGHDGGGDPIGSSGADRVWLDGDPRPGVLDVDVQLDLQDATEQLPAADAAAASATPAASATGPGAPAAAAAGTPVSTAADMVILMGALCGCAAQESEMLTCVAASIHLSTTEQDLYSYVYMLKLQPYMDERLVAAAEAALVARG